MVSPGVTTRNPRVNRGLPGRRTAFTVCQAMSIAMTVVLPAPVASLRAIRGSPAFASSLANWRRSRNAFASRPRLWSDFGQPNRGFDSLDLAEEGADPGEVVSPPVLEQACCLGGHSPLPGIADLPPIVDPFAKPVDEFHQLVLLALRRELACLLVEDDLALALLLRARDGAQERCVPPFVADLTRWLPRGVELPVPGRVLVRGVEDGCSKKALVMCPVPGHSKPGSAGLRVRLRGAGSVPVPRSSGIDDPAAEAEERSRGLDVAAPLTDCSVEYDPDDYEVAVSSCSTAANRLTAPASFSFPLVLP